MFNHKTLQSTHTNHNYTIVSDETSQLVELTNINTNSDSTNFPNSTNSTSSNEQLKSIENYLIGMLKRIGYVGLISACVCIIVLGFLIYEILFVMAIFSSPILVTLEYIVTGHVNNTRTFMINVVKFGQNYTGFVLDKFCNT